MTQLLKSEKQMIWKNIIFFAITTLVGIIGAPIYVHHHGLSSSEISLFVFMMAATGLSITAGYHRLFAHATYKAHPLVRFLFLFFGAAAFEQSAYDWSSQHRDHHRFVDTAADPYSIKKGFWYAHIGWLLFWKHPVHYENAKDLTKDSILMHQHRHYLLWAFSSGILLPVLIGALTGHALGAFIFAVCLRLTLVYHSTFFINSICHMYGKATYDIYATARDHWAIALLTYGEGYHNFHHRFPGDYRNGVRWYQWDPSKWLIALMARLGMAADLKKVSEFRILDARLAAERSRAEDWLANGPVRFLIQEQIEGVKKRYEKLRGRLQQWEEESRSYRQKIQAHLGQHSRNLAENARTNLLAAQKNFKIEYQGWRFFLRRGVQCPCF